MFQINEYIGYDVSSTAINMCKEKYALDRNKQFFVYEGDEVFLKKKFDLSMSLDVIYHLIEDEVFNIYMKNLFVNTGRFVCIYSSNYDEHHVKHVRDREFLSHIKEYFSEWELVEFIENPFKGIEQTNADFYFFKKKHSC